MDDFKSLFIRNLPLIDVRAPVEYSAGHFPGSVNLPLMLDEERRQVGITYREVGQAAALKLGHTLVCGKTKDERVSAWIEFLAQNPNAKLYCFRGGLRSQISREWIEERCQKSVEIIPGGYKALRRYLISSLESVTQTHPFLLLAGKTGCGKTEFLYRQNHPFLDLEKEAAHRGSSFGVQGTQPSQITFENRLAVGLLKINEGSTVLLEDESVMIGQCVIPLVLFNQMRSSKLLVLERSLDDRADRIIQEYVLDRIRANPENLESIHADLKTSLERISKKLGGVRFQEIGRLLDQAFLSKEATYPSAHRSWVSSLLLDYYDPHYERALRKREAQILVRGNESELLEYLKSNLNASDGLSP